MLTCGPFLHKFPNLGYWKINLLNTSSMPLDGGAPITPTWPRDLVPRPPSMFHIILFRHWGRSGKSFRWKSFDSSTSRRVLGAERDCRQQGLSFYSMWENGLRRALVVPLVPSVHGHMTKPPYSVFPLRAIVSLRIRATIWDYGLNNDFSVLLYVHANQKWKWGHINMFIVFMDKFSFRLMSILEEVKKLPNPNFIFLLVIFNIGLAVAWMNLK
jgi:hypothetical protein